MSAPLTGPSGISATTPVPRNPDGSPVPRAKAAHLRATTPEPAQEQLAPPVPDEREVQGGVKVTAPDPLTGPLSEEEAERRLRIADELEERERRAAGEELATFKPVPIVARDPDEPTPQVIADLQDIGMTSQEALPADAVVNERPDAQMADEFKDLFTPGVLKSEPQVPAKPQVDTPKAQVATSEDEATVQAAYGKSTDELAKEAEQGYEVPVKPQVETRGSSNEAFANGTDTAADQSTLQPTPVSKPAPKKRAPAKKRAPKAAPKASDD